MTTLNPTTSLTEGATRTGYIPELRPDATVEEIDEWIVALGGIELTQEEIADWNKKTRWANVPGESIPL